MAMATAGLSRAPCGARDAICYSRACWRRRYLKAKALTRPK
jgi:hypothetical protein